MKSSRRTDGFTLIETLIYLALFTLIIGGLIVAAFALFENADRNQTKAMLQQEAGYIQAKVAYALNNAETICDPLNNATGSSLDVQTYGGACGAHTIVLTSGDVLLDGTRLNNTNVSIGGLKFTHVYDASTGAHALQTVVTAETSTANGLPLSYTATTTRYIKK